MTDSPSPDHLFDALHATWAPVDAVSSGPWIIRNGAGGGKRVSAASTRQPVESGDILAAEESMIALDQVPVFMIRSGQSDLDSLLDAREYALVDPVEMYCSQTAEIARHDPASLSAIDVAQPLQIMAEIWRAGGINDARIDVMARTAQPKTCILGRFQDRAAGAAFVASNGDIAMVHALEISPHARRNGLGRMVMGRAAVWAGSVGAKWLAVAAKQVNHPAKALFLNMEMAPSANYHYRSK